ncbi:lipopolysaccharide assembly protein LapB [uncultured Tenacibaculum sp.]|uniref:tetratricopeptide repeat protein n=1 Tax=uncultured Tenacibaculum sp. TaxID=174713 RepID=UPI002637F586|nr:hypothetical protein [uncultured Tenacibaculum sp.]
MKKVVLILIMICGLTINAQKEELENLGKKIEETLANGNTEFINSIYDVKEMGDRFLLKKTKSKKIKSFNKSFYSGFSSSFDFGALIKSEIENDATYQFLKLIEEDGDHYLLFRLYGQGVNYHKHLLKKDNGNYKIIDTYIYITGEYLSDTFKSIYMGALLSQGILSNSSTNKSIMSDLMKMNEIKVFLNRGEVDKAKKAYESISSSSKEKKIFKLTGIRLAGEVSNEAYTKAITDYEKSFPNDISLYLISMDKLILNEKYDETIVVLDKLNAALNGDPFLDYMKGNVYLLKKDLEKAETLFKKVTNIYPDFMDAYDSLLSIYIEKDNLKEAISILDTFVKDFELPKEILFETLKQNYPEFSKKEEVINWSNQ